MEVLLLAEMANAKISHGEKPKQMKQFCVSQVKDHGSSFYCACREIKYLQEFHHFQILLLLLHVYISLLGILFPSCLEGPPPEAGN